MAPLRTGTARLYNILLPVFCRFAYRHVFNICEYSTRRIAEPTSAKSADGHDIDPFEFPVENDDEAGVCLCIPTVRTNTAVRPHYVYSINCVRHAAALAPYLEPQTPPPKARRMSSEAGPPFLGTGERA